MYNHSYVLTSPQPQRSSIPSSYTRQIPPPIRQIPQQIQYRIPPSPIRYQQPIYRPTYQPIYQTSPVRQYSNSIHQQVAPRVSMTIPQATYITQSRAAQPNYYPQYLRQSQPCPSKQIVQKPQMYQPNQQTANQKQTVPQQYQQRQSAQAPQTQSNYQIPPPQYTHKPQYSQPPVMSQQDEDLEKKFQEAIDRTRDLVQKYHQPYQQQPEAPPQEKHVEQQDLQDLALQYEDGYIYRGQGYEPAVREGFGVLTDQNDNEVYSGYWHDNQYHGQGKLINFSAEQIDGPFDYRDLSNIENGWLGYEGGFHQGKMHGEGTLQLTNGEKFSGQFQDGMIDGKGIYATLNNQDIRGVWRDGVMEQ